MKRTAWAGMPAAAVLIISGFATLGVAQTPIPGSPVSATTSNGGQPPSPVPVMEPASSLPPALPPSVPPLARVRGTLANPLATGMELKPIPTLPGDLRFPINLATALRLADARPLVVAAAQASVWVAEAELTRAKVLWVPQLNIGFDYTRHDGGGPDFNKGIMTAPSVNYFYGGAGLTLMSVSVTDAIFQPLVARQVLNARQWDIQTSKNDVALRTADAYFLVHQWRGTYAGALYSVERGRDLVNRIQSLSGELVPKVEVERARNVLAELVQRAAEARQEWRVQSANLTQILRLDPRAVVEPLEHDHTQITLIDPARPLEELMPIALNNRPELSSYREMVKAAEISIQREKGRMYLPLVRLNGFQTPGEYLQAGIFGLGPNQSMNQWRGRVDVSIQPLWQFESMGIGNLARIKAQRGMESQAIIEYWGSQDRVAGDVTRALARVQSAAARVLQADRTLRTGIITFNGNFEGVSQTIRFGNVLALVNRPQEAVYALQLLNEAFREYFMTVSDYNRAQFELFHALGYPAREITAIHTPGDVVPINTNRPSYLPPVGNGPPPATR